MSDPQDNPIGPKRPLPPGVPPPRRISVAPDIILPIRTLPSEVTSSSNKGETAAAVKLTAAEEEILALKKEIERLKALEGKQSEPEATKPVEKEEKKKRSLTLHVKRSKSTKDEDKKKAQTMRNQSSIDDSLVEALEEKEKKDKKEKKEKKEKKDKKEKKEKRESIRKSLKIDKEREDSSSDSGSNVSTPTSSTGSTIRKSMLRISTTNQDSETPEPSPFLQFFQPEPKKPKILSEADTLPKEERLRNKCINEIIETERDYIADVELMKEVFIVPLMSNNIISSAESTKIFSNIESILQISKVLCSDLEKAAEANGSNLLGGIANCFKSLADYLKMYSVYCSNQQVSLETVDACMKKTPFKNLLDENLANPKCKGLTLSSFLIKPIQRICKYPLLLRELIRYSVTDSEDAQKLMSSMDKIEAVVAVINERKREDENMKKIWEIQQMFVGEKISLPSPTRRYIMEETLKEMMEGNAKFKEVKYFLFNDLMVRAKPKTLGEGFALKTQIPIETLLVKEPDDANYASFPNIFEIVSMADGKKYLIFAENVEQKSKWVSTIEAIVNPRLEKEYKKFQQQQEERLSAVKMLQQAKKDKRRSVLPPPPANPPSRVQSARYSAAPKLTEQSTPSRFSSFISGPDASTILKRRASISSKPGTPPNQKADLLFDAIRAKLESEPAESQMSPRASARSTNSAYSSPNISRPSSASTAQAETENTPSPVVIRAASSQTSSPAVSRQSVSSPKAPTAQSNSRPSSASISKPLPTPMDTNKPLPSPEQNNLRIKCTYKSDSRFVELPMNRLQYDELVNRVSKKFGISQPTYWIRFKDEDDDLLTMVGQDDLDIALYEFHISELLLFDK